MSCFSVCEHCSWGIMPKALWWWIMFESINPWDVSSEVWIMSRFVSVAFNSYIKNINHALKEWYNRESLLGSAIVIGTYCSILRQRCGGTSVFMSFFSSDTKNFEICVKNRLPWRQHNWCILIERPGERFVASVMNGRRAVYPLA